MFTTQEVALVKQDVLKNDGSTIIRKGSVVYIFKRVNHITLEHETFICEYGDNDLIRVYPHILYPISHEYYYYKMKFQNGENVLIINSNDLPTKLGSYLVFGGVKVRAYSDLVSEDWKSNNPPIPASTILSVHEILFNFYGIFLEVWYEGMLYYINSEDVVYLGKCFELEGMIDG